MWAEVPGKALQRREAVGAGWEDGPTWNSVGADGSQARGLDVQIQKWACATGHF